MHCRSLWFQTSWMKQGPKWRRSKGWSWPRLLFKVYASSIPHPRRSLGCWICVMRIRICRGRACFQGGPWAWLFKFLHAESFCRKIWDQGRNRASTWARQRWPTSQIDSCICNVYCIHIMSWRLERSAAIWFEKTCLKWRHQGITRKVSWRVLQVASSSERITIMLWDFGASWMLKLLFVLLSEKTPGVWAWGLHKFYWAIRLLAWNRFPGFYRCSNGNVLQFSGWAPSEAGLCIQICSLCDLCPRRLEDCMS